MIPEIASCLDTRNAKKLDFACYSLACKIEENDNYFISGLWNFLGGPLLLNNTTSEVNYWSENFYANVLKVTWSTPPIFVQSGTVLSLRKIWKFLHVTWNFLAWKTGNTHIARAYYVDDLYPICSKQHCRVYTCIVWLYYAHSHAYALFHAR